MGVEEYWVAGVLEPQHALSECITGNRLNEIFAQKAAVEDATVGPDHRGQNGSHVFFTGVLVLGLPFLDLHVPIR